MRLVCLSVLTLVLGCADQRAIDDMGTRLASLEKKVEELEKRPAAAATPSKAADPNSPDEQAATAIMQEIQQAQQAGDFMLAKTKLADLQAKYPDTRAGKASTRMATELNLVGADAKAIEAEKWFQGQASLSDSKATLLVFWEVWCPHCKREMPKMQPLADKWKGKGLQVVGLTKVTKSATEESAQAFLKENNITFPNLKEKEGSMSAAYAVSGIPAAAIVRDGKVVWRGHPARLTDDMLEKLVNG